MARSARLQGPDTLYALYFPKLFVDSLFCHDLVFRDLCPVFLYVNGCDSEEGVGGTRGMGLS